MTSAIFKEKLVRDKMADICASEVAKGNQEYTLMNVRVADDQEVNKFLLYKMIEEVNEIQNLNDQPTSLGVTYSRKLLTEEIADLQECIRAFVKRNHLDQDEINAVQVRKRDHRGGFSNGLIWDGVR